MRVTVKVDMKGFLAMAKDLARYSATPYDRVLSSEGASVVKICALDSSIASAAAIRRDVKREAETGRARALEEAHLTINTTREVGRHWFVPPGKSPSRGPGGTFRMVYGPGKTKGHHLSAGDWQSYLLAAGRIADFVKVRTAELLARRGIQRMSWIQIGDALGQPLSAVAPTGNLQESLARGARGPGGRQYPNGTAAKTNTGRELVITLANASPLAIRNQTQAAMDRAINRRARGFDFAMRKGVLEDLQMRARRWPGIFVSPN